MPRKPPPPAARAPRRRHGAPRVRLMIGSAKALGPGKAALLDSIDSSGSISAAARLMGISYRRAWSLVAVMNSDFIAPLIETAPGGKGGGGAILTALGREVLDRYQALERKAQEAVAEDVAAFAPLLRCDDAE